MLINVWPFVVLLASVVWILVAITRLRLHPFLALILGALAAGALARIFPQATVVAGVPVIASLADVVRLTTDECLILPFFSFWNDE